MPAPWAAWGGGRGARPRGRGSTAWGRGSGAAWRRCGTRPAPRRRSPRGPCWTGRTDIHTMDQSDSGSA
eukprot:6519433-Pyramimonas_sp.AAC.1